MLEDELLTGFRFETPHDITDSRDRCWLLWHSFISETDRGQKRSVWGAELVERNQISCVKSLGWGHELRRNLWSFVCIEQRLFLLFHRFKLLELSEFQALLGLQMWPDTKELLNWATMEEFNCFDILHRTVHDSCYIWNRLVLHCDHGLGRLPHGHILTESLPIASSIH